MNRTVVQMTKQTFNRPRGIALREGSNDLYFISGDTTRMGSSVVHHMDTTTGIVKNITSFGTLYDIHAPPSKSYIFVTNYETQSIFRVTDDGSIFNFANYWKNYNTDNGLEILLAMAPYALTRDDSSGDFYVTNYWHTLQDDSSSKYYNQVNDNVVKIVDNRFTRSYTRRRLSSSTSISTNLLRTSTRLSEVPNRDAIISLAKSIKEASSKIKGSTNISSVKMSLMID